MIGDFIDNKLDKSEHNDQNNQFTISPEKSNFFEKYKIIQSLNKYYQKLSL